MCQYSRCEVIRGKAGTAALRIGVDAALPARVSLPTGNFQLFQPFHLRHTVPGFFAPFFIISQKAASFASACGLSGFLILVSPPFACIHLYVNNSTNSLVETDQKCCRPKVSEVCTYYSSRGAVEVPDNGSPCRPD